MANSPNELCSVCGCEAGLETACTGDVHVFHRAWRDQYGVPDTVRPLTGLSDDGNEATAMADLLDASGAWDWSDEAEHGPEERLAVVERSGAHWLVYRGSEGDEATPFAAEADAKEALKQQAEKIKM
jgi:hypothetical protein